MVLPGKLTCPLKINGWNWKKIYFLLKLSLFRDMLVFRGVYSTSKKSIGVFQTVWRTFLQALSLYNHHLHANGVTYMVCP